MKEKFSGLKQYTFITFSFCGSGTWVNLAESSGSDSLTSLSQGLTEEDLLIYSRIW